MVLFQKLRTAGAMCAAGLWKRLLSGQTMSLLFFLGIGILIMLFLFLTVHNREPAGMSPYTVNSTLNDQSFIQSWLDHGYWKHGGMRIVEIDESTNSVKLYRSSFYAHYIVPYLLAKIHMLWTGDNQYYPLPINIYNQFVIMLSAALLALLVMRLGIRAGVEPLLMLGTGGAVMFVWQTMPVNLVSYWTTFACFLLPVFLLGFLLLSEKSLFDEQKERVSHMLARGAMVVGALWCGDYLALFFFLFYFACWIFFWRLKSRSWQYMLRNFLLVYAGPVLVVGLLVYGQRYLVRLNYAHVTYQGSTFFFRSGLDGAVTYFGKVIVFSRFAQHYYSPYLAVVSLATVIALLAFVRKYQFQYSLFEILALAAPFGICVMLFQQAVMLHPHTYYNLLLLPMVLCCFGVLPILLFKLTRNHGVIAVIVLLVALGYGLNSMRSYAIQYPPTQYFYAF